MRTVHRIFFSCVVLMGFFTPVSFGGVRAFPEDAPIRAIQFVDDKEGWAIGDDGNILHSIDGGKTWERQLSGTRASLRGIHFMNPYTGWLVGRIERTGGTSVGIVLSTVDGGLKWTEMTLDNVPGLNCVRFFDERNGIACGDGTDTFPTGVFLTSDSGKTWKPIPGKRCGCWHAGDFTDMQTGAMAGTWGQLATLRDGIFGASDVDPLGSRGILGLKINGSRAVAVGQGGLILTSSRTAGMKWGFAETGLSHETLANVDFHAVSVVQNHIWAVGRPGTLVLHSEDFGQNWEVQNTGQSLPLNAVHFIDEKQGWAAGELGTIIRTADGGKTWKLCKQGAQRAAVLFIHARSANVPLDTIAWLGGEQGYLAVSLRVTSTDLTLPKSKDASEAERVGNLLRTTKANQASDPVKLAAAMRALGGASAESMWQFPLPTYQNDSTADELIKHWDQLHGERSTTQLLRQLVLAIRIWQPELIVTDNAGGQSAEDLVVEAVKQAFRLAADNSAFPEQLQTLKLSAWSTKKVCATLNKPDVTAIKFDSRATAARLGDSPQDVAGEWTRILQEGAVVPDSRWFRVLMGRMDDAATHTELMQGIYLAAGGQARRELQPLSGIEQQMMREREKALKDQRVMESLVRAQVGSQMAKPEQLLDQLSATAKQMPPDVAARSALIVGNEFVRTGQWALAREAFARMVENYPADPASIEGLRWLVRYHCSSEARRRLELGQFASVTTTSFQFTDPKAQPKDKRNGSEVVQTSYTAPLNMSMLAKRWYETTLALEGKLAVYGPLPYRDPAMQICFQSARRQLGNVDYANRWYAKYMLESAIPSGGPPLTKGADPWRDCVASEIWLNNRTIGFTPPKPLGNCPKAQMKPHLDGILNDACWQGLKALPVRTLTGTLSEEYSAEAYFTFDSDHLYVAVRCKHPQGTPAPLVKKRNRDDDLRAHDRVSILIDLDRDYQTYYQLQVDERGCVRDDCWGDLNWNPTWYVAVDSNETEWTAEIAIPLVELTAEKPGPGNTWAVNVVRTIPGKGVQAWSGPADVAPRPEGLGLLQFVLK